MPLYDPEEEELIDAMREYNNYVDSENKRYTDELDELDEDDVVPPQPDYLPDEKILGSDVIKRLRKRALDPTPGQLKNLRGERALVVRQYEDIMKQGEFKWKDESGKIHTEVRDEFGKIHTGVRDGNTGNNYVYIGGGGRTRRNKKYNKKSKKHHKKRSYKKHTKKHHKKRSYKKHSYKKHHKKTHKKH